MSFGNWHFLDIEGEALHAANSIAEEEHPIPGNRSGATRRIFNTPRNFGYRSQSIQLTEQRINDEDGPLHGLPLARGTINFKCHDRIGGMPFPEAELARQRREREQYLERQQRAEQAGEVFDEEEPINPSDFQPTPYLIDAQLNLNPTRMINHQDVHTAAARRNEPGFIYPEIELLTSRRGLNYGHTEGEITLANHDNVIGNVRIHQMSLPPHYRSMRNRYFQAWFDFINQRIRTHLADPDIPDQLFFDPRFSLSYVENYHEFQCENPLQVMENLRPYMRTLSQRVRNLRVRDWSQSDYIEGNEIGYRADLAQGLELAIYAKTSQRIRIEARTDLSERSKNRNFPFTRQTANSLDDILNLVDATAEDAATYVNQALDVLRPGLPGPQGQEVNQAAPYELVREIMRAVNHEFRDLADNAQNRRRIAHEQDLLISLIIVRNGCAPMPQERLKRAVARLQRRRVLLPPNSGHVRALAPRYQQARRVLLAEQHNSRGGTGHTNEVD